MTTYPVRQRTIRRRRAVAIAAAAAVGLAAAWPLVHQAVRSLSLPLSDAAIIRQQAADKHLDPALIAAVIYAETKFNPRPSRAGAQGLMQILPATAEFLAARSGATTFTLRDLATPDVNIAYGAYYLRYLLDRYGGDETLALAAYNGGETNVDQWLASARADHRSLTAQQIPFAEPGASVARVAPAKVAYRANYASQLSS
jgi:soluble lytic murein transglycosylase